MIIQLWFNRLPKNVIFLYNFNIPELQIFHDEYFMIGSVWLQSVFAKVLPYVAIYMTCCFEVE